MDPKHICVWIQNKFVGGHGSKTNLWGDMDPKHICVFSDSVLLQNLKSNAMFKSFMRPSPRFYRGSQIICAYKKNELLSTSIYFKRRHIKLRNSFSSH